MKKTVALLICLAMCTSLASCGGGAESEAPSSTADAGEEAEGSSDAASDETAEDGAEGESADAGSEDEKAAEAEFQVIDVVDNDQCAVKLTGIDPDDIWGYTVKAELENKSSEKTYMFSVETASINGVECDPMFATEVAPGKKSNSDINFPTEVLEENGVGDFTDIEISFRVHDSEDWEADPTALETAHVYPYGKEKAAEFVRESKDTDTVLVDNDSCAVIVTGYEDDEILGYTANLFLQNKTDQTVMFSVDEVAVNGYMADPFFAHSVAPGKCAFTSMSWADSEFEENGITDVKEITFELKAANADDYEAKPYVNESITLTP